MESMCDRCQSDSNCDMVINTFTKADGFEFTHFRFCEKCYEKVQKTLMEVVLGKKKVRAMTL